MAADWQHSASTLFACIRDRVLITRQLPDRKIALADQFANQLANQLANQFVDRFAAQFKLSVG